MKNIFSLLAGILFGVGLALSGMTDTSKVLGFLDVFGAWTPDLMFVMAAALCTTLLSFSFIMKGKSPLLDKEFYLPSTKDVDKNLILGALLFGIGWGIYGYCPGPAIAALAYLQPTTLVFLLAMSAGMLAANMISSRTKVSHT
ncbi:DUF6691 family protein [Agarilytica rhodophyticola]|uniref:DUF6691 family protein n=1 Tax=Agarilytica rhodophyticola TaxID=1737490 RepID=UPI000B340F0C|nr:DUF6691 family protein [Agarilytica rhodophyticola]